MDSQKIENLLNLSLSVSEEEREESPLLREGFDILSNTWEIIVKYQGDKDREQDHKKGLPFADGADLYLRFAFFVGIFYPG